MYEAKLYKVFAHGPGIPYLHWYGVEGDFNVMVIDLLGPSLEELFAFCSRKFSVKTVLMLGEQLLTRVEYIHSKNYIHADITPENFLIGLGKRSKMVHMIDFGLARRYKDPNTQRHIDYRENLTLTGSARYASVNASLGVEQSRRDDCEAVGIVLMYFLRSSLPWQGLKGATKKETMVKMTEKKRSTAIETLCKDAPREFVTFFNYTRSLGFEDAPQYGYLRRILKECLIREGFQNDSIYDWVVANYHGEQNKKDATAKQGEGAETTA